MNDRDLDDLIAKHGKGYNAPPSDPPLLEIRGRVYAARRRSTWIYSAGTMAAAAAVLLAFGLLTDRNTERPAQAASAPKPELPVAAGITWSPAERATASALQSAEEAVKENPTDPYYTEHLATMKSNAEYFRNLQRRQEGGAI